MTQLQILISTFGQEGIDRVAKANHPKIEGVGYLVSWQTPRGEGKVPTALIRNDFRIVSTNSRGLSRNRNNALRAASAPIVLIADDDTTFSPSAIKELIEAFNANPDVDMMFCRHLVDNDKLAKSYPSRPTSTSQLPRGYYFTSIEMAFRLKSIKGKVWFNECFGIGAPLPSGEETVFAYDAMNLGLRGLIMPITICSHPGNSTGTRDSFQPPHIAAKGAVVKRVFPFTWPLRLASHALRECLLRRSPLSYTKSWLRGIATARRLHAFDF